MKIKLNEKEMMARDYVCLALDIDDKNEILKTVEELEGLEDVGVLRWRRAAAASAAAARQCAS